MARGSAQNAKGNKANNQPASAKGAGSHLRANKGYEDEFEDFEPLVEPSANRDIAGVAIAVLAIASFIAVISPASAPVTAAVAGFYHLGFGLGAYVLPIVILLFAATLFLGEDSPLNVRSVAGGTVVFVAVVSILSLMVPDTGDSCDLMFAPQNLSASGGYIGAFIASMLQNALGKPIAMVVLLGLIVVGLVIIGFSVGGVLRSARDRAADFAERRRADVNASPWGDDDALSVPGVARPHLSILRQKGSDAAVTTVMGDDVDPILDEEDEDEDPFVDVSEAQRLRCFRAATPRRARLCPSSTPASPTRLGPIAKSNLPRVMTRATRLHSRLPRLPCCHAVMPSAVRSPDNFRWKTIQTRSTSPNRPLLLTLFRQLRRFPTS